VSSTISDLVQDAARHLERQPLPRDVVLEGVVLRIKELHEQDRLGAEPIARQLLDTTGTDSPLVQVPFIEFVISCL
jgi:hypothetical protein